MADLDQSGRGYQRVRTYLGPSLGWKEEFVLPATDITTGGIYVVQPGIHSYLLKLLRLSLFSFLMFASGYSRMLISQLQGLSEPLPLKT
jgi:hypothetical protein